jgi:hypothetical protein
MEIDKKQFRELLLWFWDMTEKARNELIAHQVAIVLLKAAGGGEGFDQFLAQTRKHSSPRLIASNREARDTIEALLAEEKPDDLLNFLRRWKPDGPIQ